MLPAIDKVVSVPVDFICQDAFRIMPHSFEIPLSGCDENITFVFCVSSHSVSRSSLMYFLSLRIYWSCWRIALRIFCWYVFYTWPGSGNPFGHSCGTSVECNNQIFCGAQVASGITVPLFSPESFSSVSGWLPPPGVGASGVLYAMIISLISLRTSSVRRLRNSF